MKIFEIRMESGLALRSCLSALALMATNFSVVAPAMAQSDFEQLMARGADYGMQGQVNLSIDSLRQARDLAADSSESTRASAALGRALLRGQQYSEAANHLESAMVNSSGAERAELGIDLGTVAQYQRQPARARDFYRQAIAVAADHPLQLSAAELSLARMLDKSQALTLLNRVNNRLSGRSGAANLQVNLGNQAAARGATRLAYNGLQAAVAGSQQGSRTQDRSS